MGHSGGQRGSWYLKLNKNHVKTLQPDDADSPDIYVSVGRVHVYFVTMVMLKNIIGYSIAKFLVMQTPVGRFALSSRSTGTFINCWIIMKSDRFKTEESVCLLSDVGLLQMLGFWTKKTDSVQGGGITLNNDFSP